MKGHEFKPLTTFELRKNFKKMICFTTCIPVQRPNTLRTFPIISTNSDAM